jgi:predicted AlkP superfamily pyrophosphatase or phosphodiesterase
MRDGFIEVYVLLQIVGTALFMYGFFPPRIVLQNNATLTVNNSIREGRKADRLILMIIDAFSFDFVANPNYADDMSFLHSSIDRGDLTLFRMNVQSPTVTLPRIKVFSY